MASNQDSNGLHAFVLYRYAPSLPAAIVFVVIFSMSTSFHIRQAARYKTYYFIPFILGGFFQLIGYISRAISHFDKSNLGPYITQDMLLLLAPTLFAASIYMIPYQLILLTNGEHASIIKSRRLTEILICGDFFSFLLLGIGKPLPPSTTIEANVFVGGGLMASKDWMNLGRRLGIIGFLLQILLFIILLVSAAVFHCVIVRFPTAASRATAWKECTCAIYAASILILIRSLFRMVVLWLPPNCGLNSFEAFFYIFDSALMAGVMVLFNSVHPGAIISGRRKHASRPGASRDESG